MFRVLSHSVQTKLYIIKVFIKCENDLTVKPLAIKLYIVTVDLATI